MSPPLAKLDQHGPLFNEGEGRCRFVDGTEVPMKFSTPASHAGTCAAKSRAMSRGLEHPNVWISYGADLFPDSKCPETLYLTGATPGDPLHVVCPMTPRRFTVLQEFAQRGNRVVGYNCERR
jgi:hypothetical protein